MPVNPKLNAALSVNVDIREVGKIQSVREFLVSATGMPSCFNGQIVEFKQGHWGLVMGFKEEEIQILVLDLGLNLRIGDEVFNRGRPLELPVGEAFLGRMVNGLCEPVDGLGPIEAQEVSPVFTDAPGVMDRIPVDATFETGTLAIDAVIPIAKGQRQLLIGDRMTGKTTVAIDAILNQKQNEVICIYCSIGKPYASLMKISDLFNERGVIQSAVIVNATSSTSVGQQYLSPYTACMLGEYFMRNGRDVFVVFDDLTKHAWVYRQISLLLERAPGREAYPGDIFYLHSQFMERAAYLKPEIGGGSMTFFPIVETLQGDMTGYIPTNIISMTDGQLYFNSALYYKGIKPPIDFGLSVSRIGNKAQWPAMRELCKNLRLEYLQYQELVEMTRLRASGLSEDAQKRLMRGEAITHLLIQDKNKPMPIIEQVVILCALEAGILDTLFAKEIKELKNEAFPYVQKEAPEVVAEVNQSKSLSKENRKKIETALTQCARQIMMRNKKKK
jgi:F-type H+-transporting ATPase subunit alpha